MKMIFLIVLFAMAGLLGWVGWELRAIRKTLLARWGKGSSLQGIVNHSIPCFHLAEEARIRSWKERCENDYFGKLLKEKQANLTQNNVQHANAPSVSQINDAASLSSPQAQADR